MRPNFEQFENKMIPVIACIDQNVVFQRWIDEPGWKALFRNLRYIHPTYHDGNGTGSIFLCASRLEQFLYHEQVGLRFSRNFPILQLTDEHHIKQVYLDCDADAVRIVLEILPQASQNPRRFDWRSHFHEDNPVTFLDGGQLIPVTVTDWPEVLMLAYMNRAAFQATLDTGFAHYYSRSRRRLWRKGEQSGHVQKVRRVHFDPLGPAILLDVEQEKGTGACHQGYRSCFHRQYLGGTMMVVHDRLFDPSQVY